MPQLVALDNKNHKHLTVDASKAEQHGKNLHLVPAVISEFTNMAIQYPLVITKHADTGQFVFAAMLGFEAGENLFWQDEQWQGLYLPLQIRRQPFFLGDSVASDKQQESVNYNVYFDQESPTLTSSNGQALYDETGEATVFFEQAKSCLAQLFTGEIENRKLLTELERLDLLQVMTMEITFANQQCMTLNGLYTIDTEKLAALSGDNIAVLHQQALLQPIYTLISSLGQIHHLIDLKNKQLTD